MFSSKIYTLHKSKRILAHAWTHYRKSKDRLTQSQLQTFEQGIRDLKAAVEAKNRESADKIAKQLEIFIDDHFPKPWWKSIVEVVGALAFALVIATVVRQSWFELYEIPTGSMRPTFREQDHLTVSKTQMGINVPLQTEHFYFDPNLVQRASTIIFSGDGLPVIDTDSTFLGIFPYTKRFVKRLIGKPGDTLYFYGGHVWGIDKDGEFINELVHSPWMEALEYIPFINFDGVPSFPAPNQVVFEQMHLPLARMQLSRTENPKGDIFVGNEWIPDNPADALKPHTKPVTYSDFWGIGNFALARLLTQDQVKADKDLETPSDKDALFYFELRHHPSVTYPKPQIYTSGMMTGITLSGQKTVIPVEKRHLDALRKNLYTARFVVKNGKATRYSVEEAPFRGNKAALAGVPDGTYEFYHGQALKVGMGGWLEALPDNHPLYNPDPQFFQKLYNLGINWDLAVEPGSKSTRAFPSRYAYFRDGELYLLGGKIYAKDDPVLGAFVAKEKEKSSQSNASKPYLPFLDPGPPLKNGTIDKDFIKSFGFTLPDHHYLVLGDNHAMSGDSRIFGFVPEANLQGVPSLIIWPPGERWGFPFQNPYPVFVLPRLIIWGIVLLIAGIAYMIHLRRSKITL